MRMNHNEFKDNHEELAAKKFLNLYNQRYNTQFKIIEKSESPDFKAIDVRSGAILNFEETLATRSPIGPQIWKAMLEGLYNSPGPQTLDVTRELCAYRDNIVKKFSKKYGSGYALIAFQFGPVMPWEFALEQLKSMIDFEQSPFDKGVFLISWEELHRLDE